MLAPTPEVLGQHKMAEGGAQAAAKIRVSIVEIWLSLKGQHHVASRTLFGRRRHGRGGH